MTYPERTEPNMTKPTWQQVLKIMKDLQIKYQIPIFAATFNGECTCCSKPCHLNEEAYLNPEVKDLDWEDVDSYIIFANSSNGHGEAELLLDYGIVWDPVFEENKLIRKQYVMYKVSKKFKLSDLKKCLTEFVSEINQLTETRYELSFPKDKRLCPIIEEIEYDPLAPIIEEMKLTFSPIAEDLQALL